MCGGQQAPISQAYYREDALSCAHESTCLRRFLTAWVQKQQLATTGGLICMKTIRLYRLAKNHSGRILFRAFFSEFVGFLSLDDRTRTDFGCCHRDDDANRIEQGRHRPGGGWRAKHRIIKADNRCTETYTIAPARAISLDQHGSTSRGSPWCSPVRIQPTSKVVQEIVYNKKPGCALFLLLFSYLSLPETSKENRRSTCCRIIIHVEPGPWRRARA